MNHEIDNGVRQLAEPICAKCGGGLEYDGGTPQPEDIVACDNPKCGAPRPGQKSQQTARPGTPSTKTSRCSVRARTDKRSTSSRLAMLS
jgi:hypothetical protein